MRDDRGCRGVSQHEEQALTGVVASIGKKAAPDLSTPSKA
eukprot:CAMPEP_0117589844 /NCGR_PEP_ID=MMETSP0784-20121206/70636_1 /TAXON_ID=39447 /ORGANISM="" /LENGTH=39 /DNA_ID= /DNA_START= /DNA_END= /DNA_ORIENTATION=